MIDLNYDSEFDQVENKIKTVTQDFTLAPQITGSNSQINQIELD